MLENKMKSQKTEENKYMFYKLIPDNYLDSARQIKEEFKYKINIPELKIKDSKFIPNPEDKFETMLFLPLNPHRKSEGGLRTKGFFKFSYKLVEDVWYICDLDGNPVISAPEDLQNKIRLYVSDQNNQITYLPLITVITVVLNGEKTLEETIKSVISQTYPNVEYIIIDGGSKDRTLDIIKKYEDYIDYWVSEPDDGIYDAMNKGIKVALGSYYVFLGSDDKIIKDWLEKGIHYINTLLKFEDTIYLYGNIVFSTKWGKIRYKYLQLKDLSDLKKEFTIPHSGSIISSKLFRSNFLYDKKYKIVGDYAWVLSVVQKIRPVYIDCYQIEMMLGGKSNNPRSILAILKEIKMLEKDFGININRKFKIKKIIGYIASKAGIFEKVQFLYWQAKSLNSK
jgi:glycosyltransferase involved in cell wall biosynthesis